MPQLVLYHYESCPYCVKVRRAIDALELTTRIELRDTRKVRAHYEALIQLNGLSQVPCLVIDGKPMLESDDIIAYLYREFGQGKTPPRRSWF